METNETILEVVAQWMELKNIPKLDEGIWGNEYTEYYCNENDFGVLRLKKFNIEIHSELIWIVPIQSVHEFVELMKILEPNT